MANYNGNMLPNITDEKMDDEKERKQILNYLAMLDEKLRYMFQNIEPEENFSPGAFQNYIKNKEMITSLQVEDGRISALIRDMDGNFSLLVQTVTGIQTTVQNQAGDISQIQQTAEKIQSTVTNLKGDLSDVEQEADKISWIVRSGTSASNFTLTSRMASLVAEEIDFTGYVTFNDLSRSGGKTEINGGNITTGKIDAMSVTLGSKYGGFECASGNDGRGSTTGAMMYGSDSDNYFIATGSGVRMTYNEEYAVYCTTNGVTLVGDYDFRAATNFYCMTNGGASLGTSTRRWDTVFADTGEINTSDRREKEDIGYEMGRYEELFHRLRPTQYRMKNGRSGRYHIGFIAQDIEEAMGEIGMGSEDFAGFIKSPVYAKEKENGEPDEESEITDYNYALRYGEFVALNTHMIQKMEERIAALEKRIAELEGKSL